MQLHGARRSQKFGLESCCALLLLASLAHVWFVQRNLDDGTVRGRREEFYIIVLGDLAHQRSLSSFWCAALGTQEHTTSTQRCFSQGPSLNSTSRWSTGMSVDPASGRRASAETAPTGPTLQEWLPSRFTAANAQFSHGLPSTHYQGFGLAGRLVVNIYDGIDGVFLAPRLRGMYYTGITHEVLKI